MKRFIAFLAVAAFLGLPSVGALAAEPAKSPAQHTERQNLKMQEREHPEIAKAIQGLDGAIADLEKAGNDFGGHKEAAIKASRDAREQLRLALAYTGKEGQKSQK